MTGFDGIKRQETEEEILSEPLVHLRTPEEVEQRAKTRTRKHEQDFMASFRLAATHDPEVEGKAQRAAQQLNIAPELALQNLEVATAVMKEQAAEYQELVRKYPAVFGNLTRPEFARLAHDDLPNLKEAETYWGELSNAMEMKSLERERGWIGARRYYGIATPEEIDRLAQIDAQLQNRVRTGIGGTVLGVGSDIVAGLPMAVAGGAAGSVFGPVGTGFGAGAGVFTNTAIQEGGNTYLDMLADGVDEKTARTGATGAAIFAGALEAVSFKFVAKPFKEAFGIAAAHRLAKGLTQETATAAWTTAVKDFAKGYGAEVGVEVIQEAGTIAAEEWARLRSKPDEFSKFETYAGRTEMVDRMLDIFSTSAIGFAPFAGVGPATRVFADARRARAASERSRLFDRMVKNASESQVASRNPDERERFTESKVNGTLVETTYIDGRAAEEVFKQSGVTDTDLDTVLPGLASKVHAAARDGSDLQIPTSVFDAKIVRTEVGKQLVPLVRFDPEEVVGSEEGAAEMEKEAAVEAKETKKRTEEFKTSGRKVQDQIQKQLEATGMQPRNARSNAILIRSFHEVQAEARGLTPEEAFAEHPLTVGSEGEGALRQFAGPRSQTANLFDFAAAQKLEKEGADETTIRTKTGWFRGHDKKWRYEISDANAKFAWPKMLPRDLSISQQRARAHRRNAANAAREVDPNNMFLGDVLEHPALLRAYPQLANIKIEQFATGGGVKGYASALDNAIGLSDQLSNEEALSILLHELQHLLQFYEGFAQGGGDRLFDAATIQILRDKELKPAMAALQAKYPQDVEAFERYEAAVEALRATGKLLAPMEAMHADQRAKFDAMLKAEVAVLTSEGARAMVAAKAKANNLNAFEAYMRLAGEVEARNTQDRKDLDIHQREVLGAEATEDRPRASMIFAFGLPQVIDTSFSALLGTFDPNDSNILRQSATGLSRAARRLLRNLTPTEQKKITNKVADKVIKQLKKLPSAKEIAAIAEAGQAKRGWYRESARALVDIFGADAPRFAMLLAAMSPQTSVETNLTNALNTWRNWIDAGRPTDRAAILGVMAASVQGKKGAKSVLPAWRNNTVRALTTNEPSGSLISGPKVNSFFRNLIGDVNEVTLDAWMANFALVDQAMFDGSLTKTDAGKRPGYLAFSARVREAAKVLTDLTGKTWTPSEVQETVWSWAKTLYELQDRIGLSATEALDAGLLTDELINSTPDFSSLLQRPEYATILTKAGYGRQLEDVQRRVEQAAAAQPVEGSAAEGQAAAFAPEARRVFERRAARRLERLRRQRLAAERETRAGGGSFQQLQPGSRGRLRTGGLEVGARYGEAQPDAVSAVGVHYSRAERESLTGAAYGTGLRGAERQRVAGDDVLDKRVHFYVDIGQGILPEPGVGAVAHAVRLDNLYDLAADPRGLLADALKKREAAAGMEWFNGFERAVVEAGFDGVLVSTAQGDQGVAVLIGPKHTAVPVSVLGSQQLAQSAQDKGQRGSFNPSDLSIVLTPNADATTFLHEASHYFLTVYADLASREVVPAQIRADMDALLKWFGVKDIATWNAMSIEQQRKHHEAFAVNFENYIATGKAPSRELEGIFARMRRWLIRVYTAVRETLAADYEKEFGEKLPELSPEVRAVMDRMLASQMSIEQAQVEQGLLPAFETEEEAAEHGVTAEEFADLKRQHELAAEEGIADLTAASLRDMSRTERDKSKFLRELRAKQKATRSRVEEDVRAELANKPVWRAQQWLKTGVYRDENGNETPSAGEGHKLHRDLAKQALAAQQLLDGRTISVEEQVAKLRGMLDDKGLPPDVVAPRFGYESGGAMVQDIATQPTFEEAVASETDAHMLLLHGELVEDKKIQAAMIKALHNAARQRAVATELRALDKAGEPVGATLAAAKQAARRAIRGLSVRELQPRTFALAAARAAREARAALKGKKAVPPKGDKPGSPARAPDSALAWDWKRKQLLQGQMAIEAQKAREEVEEALRDFAKFRRPPTELRKTRNVDLVLAARAILGAYGLDGGSTRLPLEHVQLIQKYDQKLWAEIEPLIARFTGRNTLQDYRNLTFESFQILQDGVEMLWWRSERDQQVKNGDRRVQRKEAIRAMVDRMIQTVGMAGPGRERALSTLERGGLKALGIKAWLTRVEHWALMMDGGKPGPVTQFVWTELRNRSDDYRVDKNTHLKQFRDLLDKLDLQHVQIDAQKEIGYTFKDMRELIGALLHSGNASNLRKLLLGRKDKNGRPWGDLDRDGEVDATRWNALLRRLEKDGVIEKKHWDFVQAVWDMNEALKPRAQKTMHEVYGVRFEELPLTPITTLHGTYRGGYMPAKVDPNTPEGAAMPILDAMQELEEIGKDFKSRPGVGRGFTIERTGVTQPLLLDVHLQLSHMDNVLRFIHLQPAIRDVLSILYDPDFAQPMARIDQFARRDLLLPWLERTAQQRVVRPGPLGSFFTFLRSAAGAAIMFANPVNALQQLTGISNATTYVPARALKAGAEEYVRRRKDAVDEIVGLSRFMDLRLKQQVGGLQDDIELALQPGRWASVQRWTKRHAYFMQHAVQNQVDITIWLGAYRHAMAEAGVDVANEVASKAAVETADKAVRLSQGSTTPEDIARYESGSAFARLFTQFSGYWNAVLNQIMAARPGSERTVTALRALVVPAMIGATIQQLFWGGWDDDDDDGTNYDEMGWWMLTTQLRAAMALAPGIGPAITSLASSEGDRLALSPAMSMAQAGWRGLDAVRQRLFGDKESLTGRDWRDILSGLSAASGLPVSAIGRPVGYGIDVATGDIEPTGPIDLVRGLISGRASPGTKQ